MYLATKTINGESHYYIRESYRDGDVLRSRGLFDLGTAPYEYIIYPGGNAYYIDEVVEDRLRAAGAEFDDNDLDDIFWPFIQPDIRRALEHFRRRGSDQRARSASQATSGDQFHLFDRRRVHYLRYGQMDQGRIGRVSPKLFRVLCDKSRDEMEQYFMRSEHILRPHELKSYVFVIFDLQKHFSESFAKTMPQGLDQRAVDTFFIKNICNLNKDEKFWSGTETGRSLHDYLIRYLIMFFDNDYGRSSFLDDIVQEWINRHRDYRAPKPRPTVTVREASTVFGVSEECLRKMSRRELAKIFRRKAQELHPDKGGDHEAFIRLTEAYQGLKERKK